MTPTLLFVYGTLLSDQPNHHLLSTSVPLGKVATSPHYELFDLGPYPAMTSGGQKSIRGELYQVDGVTLAALDAFEEHPTVYERVPIALLDGRNVDGYLMPRRLLASHPVIPSGVWASQK